MRKLKFAIIPIVALLLAISMVFPASSIVVFSNGQLLSINSDVIVAAQQLTKDVQVNTTPKRYSGATYVETMPWGYRYQLSNGDVVEVGDSSTPDFKANIKTIRYDGVCWFSLGWAGGTFVPTLNGLTTSFNYNTNTQVSIYPVEPNTRLPEGGIEYDITLLKRPSQTTITLNVDWQSITWEKLLPLNVEYTEAKCEELYGADHAPYVLTATSIVGSDGVTYKTRQEYEVNSYLGTALDCHRETTNYGNNANGQPISYTNVSRSYLYIHRGQITDAVGNKAWVEDINLDQTNKTITFTLPRDWLSKTAVYPIHQVCGVDPAYTQKMGSFQSTALASDGVWDEYDLTALAGDNVVAEIILSNSTTGTENTLGVSARASDHTPTNTGRYLMLHEAEGGGQTHCRMFVQTDANGIICAYHSDVSDADYYYVVGYWSNVTFTEMDSSHTVSSADTWEDWTLGMPSTPYQNKVCHFIIKNSEPDVANTIGVRAKGSSVERKILVHEPEAGGVTALDIFEKADASGKVQVYSSETAMASILLYGYFDSSLDFVEKWQEVIPLSSGWQTTDLTSYLDVDGRMVDVLVASSAESSTNVLGVRGGDDTTTERKLTEHESESASGAANELTGFSMSAQSNASGLIYINWSASPAYAYLTGYFKPASSASLSNSPSSKAFGIVAENTTYYAKGSAPNNPVVDGDCTFTITNDGSIAVDIDIHGHSFTGGVGWTLTSGAPGSNTVRVTVYKTGDNPASGIVITTADQEFVSNLATSGTKCWDFKLETGTFGDGAAKSGVLTLTARAVS